jgi:putative lysine transport system substrate-binding protein
MIKVNPKVKEKHTLSSNDLSFTFLPTGDLLEATGRDVMLNQVVGNNIDGSMNNLYLRVFENNGEINYAPLLGVESTSTFSTGKDSVKWTGIFSNIEYTVLFTLGKHNTWFWTVELEGQNKEVDVIYGFDLGLSQLGALQSNESYVAQYIGHSVFENENGYVICSRQNQAENIFPYVQQGSLTKNKGYSTDGFQFFKKSYKETNQPGILKENSLENKIYQYEFNYSALQTEKMELNGKDQVIFYGLFQPNHPEAITELEFEEIVQKDWETIEWKDSYEKQPKIALKEEIGEPLKAQSIEKEELEEFYPNRLQEEKINDQLMSFFTEDYSHVVLKEKEVEVERQHGQILFTGNELTIEKPIMSTTSWMNGVFNSHLVLGNTSMNKLLTNTRNHLNVLKTQGQRIYVKINDTFRLLTMPSLFEIGFNYTKWIYKTNDETFIVTNFSSSYSSDIQLEIKTKTGNVYDYKVTNQIVLNESEYSVPYHFEIKEDIIEFSPDSKSVIENAYPALNYKMKISAPSFKVKDGSDLLNREMTDSSSLMVIDIPAVNGFTVDIQGSTTKNNFENRALKLEQEALKFKEFFGDLMHHFELEHENPAVQSEVEKMNIITWWYTHNMFVHYLSPHGLEQYGGAAWGTRDVAQGPAEYFMAMRQFDVVKHIILKLFSHQFIEDGIWPQWFMFDKYLHVFSEDSHDDIIVWPLKLLGDYLKATDDFDILDEEIPYLSRAEHIQTEVKESLLEHVDKILSYIQSHFVEGTALSSYGGGDWNDSLQPNDEKLKEHMVSSWTVALTYQALKQFSDSVKDKEISIAQKASELAERIKNDYEKFIMIEDIIPGFVYIEDGETEFIIHPKDTKTGITYRLLPMIRSMISELFDEKEVDKHYNVIKNKLTFLDGVRLMDKPANYEGGVSTNFKRAEQAANFGREIGLLYIHAHIRYIEAMAKIGKVDETWENLLKINPINITDHVPNAQIRQSNAYFSSSDGDFADRYDARDNFEKLKTGEVEAKGGWRIYSSGPGIYLNQLIANVLGVREEAENIIIDPVIPEKLDGLSIRMNLFGKPVKINYEKALDNQYVMVNGNEIMTRQLKNRYRKTGYSIKKKMLEEALNTKNNEITVNFK